MEDQLNLKIIECKKDSYITIEGEQKTDCFYIIKQGKVRISKGELFKGEAGSILGPGDFFGIISVISGHSHIETACALTNVTLITVYKSQYGEFINTHPELAVKIVKHFSKQLRFLGKTLAKYTFNKLDSGDQLNLFMSAEYYYFQKRYKIAFHTYYQYLKHYPKGEFADSAKNKIAALNEVTREVTEYIKCKDPIRSYDNDAMIFAEGEPGEEMFIIQAGSVKITKIIDNNEILLTIQKAGDIFGEMALLENKPRDANAIAFGKCRLMAVNKNNFEMMIQSQTKFIAKITTLLADRIWLIHKQLDNTCLNNLKARFYNVLVIQLERNRVALNSNESYYFNFSEKELYSMIGVSESEGSAVLKEILKEKKFYMDRNTMWTKSVSELVRHAEYYKRIDQLENKR